MEIKISRYKNTTTYNRSRKSKSHHKKSLSIDIVKNTGLNAIDIGILTILLFSSKAYVINKGVIMKRAGIPKGKFNNSWAKLQNLGYLNLRRFQGGVEWVINEIPVNYGV